MAHQNHHTLTPEGQALLARCQRLQRDLDTLRDQMRDYRDALVPLCPVKVGDRLDAATRYQPGLVVETITATTDDDDVIWTVRGPVLTKTGKAHATQHSYRYIYGHAPDQEPQA